MTSKYKILLISDHALSTSGVGVQSRFVGLGLVSTGKYTIRQFGGAIKHSSLDVVKAHDDFIIKPVEGFGTRELLRVVLATERPDVLMLFNDPRFFTWIWEMEDEIHQICPISYWNLWDGQPFPRHNAPYYESTDLLNCINKQTYDFLKPRYGSKVNYVPHAIPSDVYFPMPREKQLEMRRLLFGHGSEDWFVGLWVNRNAHRKRPGDVLTSWKFFLDTLEKKHGRDARDRAKLVLHTDPRDQEGTDMPYVVEELDIAKNIVFSADRTGFEQMNMLYNAVDFTLNISHSEGFGLPTLETMMAGKPIVAAMTGGLKDQIVNPDGTENGVALKVDVTSYVGSLQVPYITQDFVSCESTARGIMALHEMGPETRAQVGERARKNALERFSIDDMIADWDRTLTDVIERWRTDRKSVYTPWRSEDL